MSPQLHEGEIIKLVVAKVTARGVFLAVPDHPEIFMPSGEVKGKVTVSEAIWVGLYLTNGHLTATMKLDKLAMRFSQPAQGLKKGDLVTGLVYNLTSAGAFIRTTAGYLGHIPTLELVGKLTIGHKVEARITQIREDGRLNLSIRPLKEVGRISDAELILEYMRRNQSKMAFTDETAPAEIMEQFGISKRAFKRALGKLLKDGLIKQEAGYSCLVTTGTELS